MKAVPKINLDGFYIEDAIVDDAFSGVVPFYADPVTPVTVQLLDSDAEAGEEKSKNQPQLAGYIIGLPLPSGLYLPRFDLAAWQTYQDSVKTAQESYRSAYTEWTEQPEEGRGEPPIFITPEQPKLWGEGLTPEEIEALHLPQEPSITDLLGIELTAIKLQTIQQQSALNNKQSLGWKKNLQLLNSKLFS